MTKEDDSLRLRVEAAAEPNDWIVIGELDSHSADLVSATVRGGDGEPPSGAAVGLDMSQVAFIDSSGLRALVELRGDLVRAGGSLHIQEPSDAVRRVVELTGLAEHLGLN